MLTRRTALTALLSLPVLTLARPARAATHQVAIKGFTFEPAVMEVAAGDTVVFTNGDSAPHTASGSAFDTGRINFEQSAEVTIAAAGTYDYTCQFHPMMKGRIVAR